MDIFKKSDFLNNVICRAENVLDKSGLNYSMIMELKMFLVGRHYFKVYVVSDDLFTSDRSMIENYLNQITKHVKFKIVRSSEVYKIVEDPITLSSKKI